MKKKLSPETFNTLFFAAFLVVAVLLAWGVLGAVQLARRANEKSEQMQTQAGATPTVTYRLEDPLSGALYLPSEAQPWNEAEVDRVGQGLVPLASLTPGECPYALASSALRLKGEALYALTALCTDLARAGYGATPYITRAYLSYREAGAEAGRSYFHTGYALSLSLLVEGGKVLSLDAAAGDPSAAGAALWLSVYAQSYGFVAYEDGFYYVGVPHALAMAQLGLSLSASLDALRLFSPESPLTFARGDDRYTLYYLASDHGAATLTLPETVALWASGDGKAGFLVALVTQER